MYNLKRERKRKNGSQKARTNPNEDGTCASPTITLLVAFGHYAVPAID